MQRFQIGRGGNYAEVSIRTNLLLHLTWLKGARSEASSEPGKLELHKRKNRIKLHIFLSEPVICNQLPKEVNPYAIVKFLLSSPQ